MIDGKYKSRKNKKRAMSLRQYGGDGYIYTELVAPFYTDIMKRLRDAFGSSKHRGARMLRFNARQRGR